ncbi:MAG: DNA replication/repair protein RecF [Clostridia bacterium]|nr:DNA replication/repair protein RecF [Clostridia bacterium]
MNVKKIQLQNFRNFEMQEFQFESGVNILLGDNAQGKTNVLEALWLFSACKSFRVSDDKPFLRIGEHRAAIYGEYERNGRIYRPVMKFYDDKRREIFLNNVAVRPREIVGQFPAVLFFPDHLSLVKGSPELRRKFLDLALCQTDPSMLPVLNEYNKVHQQRNALLKQYRERIDAKSALDIWDEKIASLSARIAAKRYEFISAMSPFAQRVMDEISGGKERLEIVYRTVCNMPPRDLEDLEDKFFYALKTHRERDILSGHTSTGVHRDDFDLFVNGENAKIYASQGQQRSVVMALKMAEADLLRSATGEFPIMLFDDVFSELDPYRRSYIIERIRGRQVILSCCEDTGDFAEAKIFRIKGGQVE